jgi:hypothetical protein
MSANAGAGTPAKPLAPLHLGRPSHRLEPDADHRDHQPERELQERPDRRHVWNCKDGGYLAV